jgi:hypothetical protein
MEGNEAWPLLYGGVFILKNDVAPLERRETRSCCPAESINDIRIEDTAEFTSLISALVILLA